MKTPIYLDYAATTPCATEVIEIMQSCLSIDGTFANPASRSHFYGWQAEAVVEKARKQVASLLNADTREIIWTSGATEANNLALKGVAYANSDKGKHIISSLTEHKAVIDSLLFLETQGYEITWLKPNHKGFVSLEQIKASFRPDTVLISIMHVNNETGAITDIKEIGDFASDKGVIFHVDAAQSAGKLPIDTSVIKADLMSVCAHKIYGPKGIGALYMRRSSGISLTPQIHGGGHEQGMRSGTLPTHQIAGMGIAFQLAKDRFSEDYTKLSKLKELFLTKVMMNPLVSLNGCLDNSVPGIVNLTFKGIDGQVLLSALPMLAVSSGSACNSATVSPSYVLTAMGVPEQEALNSLRFSFGRYTSAEEVNFAADRLMEVLEKLSA